MKLFFTCRPDTIKLKDDIKKVLDKYKHEKTKCDHEILQFNLFFMKRCIHLLYLKLFIRNMVLCEDKCKLNVPLEQCELTWKLY